MNVSEGFADWAPVPCANRGSELPIVALRSWAAPVHRTNGDRVQGRCQKYGSNLSACGQLSQAMPLLGRNKRPQAADNYYGHRSYNPDSGRWLNRDPVGEGGAKVMRTIKVDSTDQDAEYAFVQNEPVSSIDLFGLNPSWIPHPPSAKKCCPKKGGNKGPQNKVVKKFLDDLRDKVKEAAEAGDSAKLKKALENLKKAQFAIGAVGSICGATNPAGCDDFLSSGDFTHCMMCCTSIHQSFSDELAGIGFMITCKIACQEFD